MHKKGIQATFLPGATNSNSCKRHSLGTAMPETLPMILHVVNSANLNTSLWGGYHSYHHIRDEKIKSKGTWSILPNVTLPVNDARRIYSQVIRHWSSFVNHCSALSLRLSGPRQVIGMSRVDNPSLLLSCRNLDLVLSYCKRNLKPGLFNMKSLAFKMLVINFKMFLNTILETRTHFWGPQVCNLCFKNIVWPIRLQNKFPKKLCMYFKNKNCRLVELKPTWLILASVPSQVRISCSTSAHFIA